jgi:hypothetical protein
MTKSFQSMKPDLNGTKKKYLLNALSVRLDILRRAICREKFEEQFSQR